MSQILHPTGVQAALAPIATLSRNPETYQTNLNHPQHSKSITQRLTLMMLWFLRVPLIVRTAVITLLLVSLLASSAGAASKGAVRNPAHANVARSTVHRSAHSSSHASPKSPRRSRASKSKRPSQTSARRTSRSTRSAGHRTVSSAKKSAALRRTRYSHSRSRARLVPVAAVPVTRSTYQQANAEPETTDLVPSVPNSREQRVRQEAGLSGEAAQPSMNSPSETDAATAQTDASDTIAAAGNPLAAPPVSESSPAPATAQIAQLHVPRVYGRYALRGTRDSLVRQNERVEQDTLERIEDDSDLQDRIDRGLLILIPESSGLMVNPALPENRRYCRPWTADFLTDLSRAYEAKFHKPLVVSSAVRTVEYQKRLMRTNRNAADAEGDIVSPHLTGATIDIAKSGLSRSQMQWMRDHLFAYQTAGVIDVEEEFRQRCFHITVYRNYAPASSPDRPHHAPVPQTVPPDPSMATVTDDAASK